MSAIMTRRLEWSDDLQQRDLLYRELGQRVRSLRVEAGLSQAVLAQRVGLTRTSITNIEQGRQSIPLHVLYDLASALGTDLNAFLPPMQDMGDTPRVVQVPPDLSAHERQWVERVVRQHDERKE